MRLALFHNSVYRQRLGLRKSGEITTMFILVDCQQTKVRREVEDALVVAGLGQYLHHDDGEGIVLTDRAQPEQDREAHLALVRLGVDFAWPSQATQMVSAVSAWIRERAGAPTPGQAYPLHAFLQVGRPVLANARIAWKLTQRSGAILLDLSDDPHGWKLANQYPLPTFTWEQVQVGEQIASARLPAHALAVLADRQGAPPVVNAQLWEWVSQLRRVRPLVVYFGLVSAATLAAWEELLDGAGGQQVSAGGRAHPFWIEPQWVITPTLGARQQQDATAVRLQQRGASVVYTGRSRARLRRSLLGAVR